MAFDPHRLLELANGSRSYPFLLLLFGFFNVIERGASGFERKSWLLVGWLHAFPIPTDSTLLMIDIVLDNSLALEFVELIEADNIFLDDSYLVLFLTMLGKVNGYFPALLIHVFIVIEMVLDVSHADGGPSILIPEHLSC